MKQFTEADKFDWPTLTSESVCIDAGAHEGHWSYEIYQRYKCRIVALEPIPEYVAKTHKRLDGTGAVVIPVALGGWTRLESFGVHGAMSGAFSNGTPQIVSMAGIVDLLKLLKIGEVDLLKLNIEGGEFEVLETIMGLFEFFRFKNIVVQPHTCVPDYERRWKAIQEGLAGTHTCLFAEPWCWEGWSLK